MKIAGGCERFQCFKTKTFYEKLCYHFLVESTTIENATFQHKIDLSKANIKTNTIGSTKWTYYKEHSFGINYFFFVENITSV